MQPSPYEFIGVGWTFPPRFDRLNGTVEMASGDREIRESLRVLFGTRPGERVLLPDFGCDLSAEAFRNASLSERTVLEGRIRQAMLHFESRVRVESVEVDSPDALEGILRLRVAYVVLSTNSRRNIVFPFYLGEGTLVPAD